MLLHFPANTLVSTIQQRQQPIQPAPTTPLQMIPDKRPQPRMRQQQYQRLQDPVRNQFTPASILNLRLQPQANRSITPDTLRQSSQHTQRLGQRQTTGKT